MKNFKQIIKEINWDDVGIIPNNTKKDKSNACSTLKEKGEYKNWGGGLKCVKKDGFVLIYFSDNQRYECLCKVIKIDEQEKTFDLELILDLDKTGLAECFNRKKLISLGLKKRGAVRYYLGTYPKIKEYVKEMFDLYIRMFEKKSKKIKKRYILGTKIVCFFKKRVYYEREISYKPITIQRSIKTVQKVF